MIMKKAGETRLFLLYCPFRSLWYYVLLSLCEKRSTPYP